ncbi:MAG: hypothetical protein ACQER7_06275 [Bacteroidota bacterium]
MQTILLLITTYKRPEKLLEMLKDIHAYSEGFNMELIIFEDYSNSDYSACKNYLKKYLPNFQWEKADRHYGKKDYWQWISQLYIEGKEKEFDYIIQWPDDQRLTKNAIQKAVDTWEAIEDPNKICCTLSQHVKKRTRQWTPVESELVQFRNTRIYHTGWVDMNFIAEREFLEALNYTVPPVNPSFSGQERKSSGVGMNITRELFSKGYNFYQVEKSLTIHTAGYHGSVMHPEERKVNPGLTNHEKVTAALATMPERQESLKHVISSIINQVDEIHVYLNNFTSIPIFLKHEKIKVFLSDNEMNDLGDVGKFYTAESVSGYLFTIDDDIIYPPDYVSSLITEIEKHYRQYVVGTHGRIFDRIPIHSYYHGHTQGFSALNTVPKDSFVHVIGTGALAFHTDTIRVSLGAFETMNMADIWFSKFAEENNVPRLVIKHQKGWLKDSPKYDKDYSIYNFCHRDDTLQTEVVNNTKWKELPVL